MGRLRHNDPWRRKLPPWLPLDVAAAVWLVVLGMLSVILTVVVGERLRNVFYLWVLFPLFLSVILAAATRF